MQTLILYYRSPIRGHHMKQGELVPFVVDRIVCHPRAVGEEPEGAVMIAAAHRGLTDESGHAVPIAELRRWKIHEAIVEAYRDTVWQIFDYPAVKGDAS